MLCLKQSECNVMPCWAYINCRHLKPAAEMLISVCVLFLSLAITFSLPCPRGLLLPCAMWPHSYVTTQSCAHTVQHGFNKTYSVQLSLDKNGCKKLKYVKYTHTHTHCFFMVRTAGAKHLCVYFLVRPSRGNGKKGKFTQINIYACISLFVFI